MTSNKYWVYLEKLRRSGITNMFGASPYIMEEFNVDYNTAKNILIDWMKNYSRDDYDDLEYEDGTYDDYEY